VSCTPVDAPPVVPPLQELWPPEGFDGAATGSPPEQASAPTASHVTTIKEICVDRLRIEMSLAGKNQTTIL
jgi:hypothetical protein